MQKLFLFLGLALHATGVAYGQTTEGRSEDERVLDVVVVAMKARQSFFSKTVKELGTTEAQLMVTAVCAYFGTNCMREAGYMRTAASIYSRARHAGNEWYGRIEAAPGYEVCRAFVNRSYKHFSQSPGATFSGTLKVDEKLNGLSWYADVPVRASRSEWVNFQLVLEQVPQGTRERYSCWPHNAPVFRCPPGSKGACTFYKDAGRTFRSPVEAGPPWND
jgi:hypothetical protein